MKRQIKFYKTVSGNCPIKEFLDSLPGKVVQKIAWVLSVIEELEIIPAKYFKKLEAKPIFMNVVSILAEIHIDYWGSSI